MTMVNVEEIVGKLSEKYREGLEKIKSLKLEITLIEARLKDVDISHQDYLNYERGLQLRNSELAELEKYNEGIHDAREIVMVFW